MNEQHFVIHSQAVYGDSELRLGLAVTSATLAKARRAGQLRFTRKGRRFLYLGLWVLDWLNKDDQAVRK
jgi:hypothetical protein